jgi:hypothetical protein
VLAARLGPAEVHGEVERGVHGLDQVQGGHFAAGGVGHAHIHAWALLERRQAEVQLHAPAVGVGLHRDVHKPHLGPRPRHGDFFRLVVQRYFSHARNYTLLHNGL